MTDQYLPPLIQQMLQPEFYPHGVQQQPIGLIQTHISYVLLTGEYAYKVKKPMNFGFLDFSSLEKRQHFCQEEVRLNQRGAGKLYLDVLSIGQTGDRYQFLDAEAQGEPLEYAVKMRQFPTGLLFSDLFEQGSLTDELVVRLAAELARFHADAQRSDYIDSFGQVEQVRRAFDENYEQTLGFVGDPTQLTTPQTQAQFDQTKAYTDRLFAQQADLLQARVSQGHIRECHGDSHLRNIALWDNEILLFDCIEFNEPFRFVDTMYDLGFAMMDLDARGRSDWSNLLMNTYLEQTGDWPGAKVLPLYLSRQAYVRAKVTSFLLNDPSVPEAVKQDAAQTAAQYYTLAWRYTQPQVGRIILMSGLSGSGKSTTARQLARQINAVHLRSDAVRKHLAGIPLDSSGGPEVYTREMTEQTYTQLLDLGISLAAQGYAVILDAKYDRQSLRTEAIALAKQAGLGLHILYCDAPDETLRQRVAARQGDIADATVAVLAQQTLEPFGEQERHCVTTISTTADLAPQIKQFLSRG
jgi:uncharacterized protein